MNRAYDNFNCTKIIPSFYRTRKNNLQFNSRLGQPSQYYQSTCTNAHAGEFSCSTVSSNGIQFSLETLGYISHVLFQSSVNFPFDASFETAAIYSLHSTLVSQPALCILSQYVRGLNSPSLPLYNSSSDSINCRYGLKTFRK